MATVTQEIVAIIIVVIVVGIALFRYLRKKNSSTNACSGCDDQTSKNQNEKPLHFFKKQR